MHPPDEQTLRDRGFLGLRVVGDVHGDARALAAAIDGAAAARLFVVQLGDLTDHGPDSPAVLRAMFRLLDAGGGLFILGNHDHKLRRALNGAAPRIEAAGLGATLTQLRAASDGDSLAERARIEIARAPAWWRLGQRGFVHAAWHPAMAIASPPEDSGARKPDPLVSRALFGVVTGVTQPDGFPERLHSWVDRIPAGFTVYCGHDRRSTDGRPFRQQGALGGSALFLDTGAGKGGHLAWVDLPLTGAAC